MVITEITPSDENGRRQILVDGQPYISMTADMVMSLDIHVGDELDDETLETLTFKVQSVSAVQKAYSYLSYNAMSRKKLAEKLLKAGFHETAVEMALERLEELRLIDDESYGRRILEVMRHSKHWGYRRVCFEMKKRGLSDELIERLTADDFDDRNNIRHFMNTKYRKKDLSDRAERQKAVAGLSRLGFDFDDIRAVMNEFEEEL